MHHDSFALEHSLVVMSYLVIAAQFFFAFESSRKHKKAARALLCMVLIFVLCSISGYASQIFSSPAWFEQLSLWLLLLVSWVYIVTNQAGVIVMGLRNDH